jgi:two-component system sensor histidine kinase MprB
MSTVETPPAPARRPKLRRRVSFRTRLSVLAALAVGVAVAAGALASYIAVHHQLVKQVDASLVSQFNDIHFLTPSGNYTIRINAVSVGNKVELIDASGNPLTLPEQSSGPALPISASIKQLAADSNPDDSHVEDASIGGANYRLLAVSLGPVQVQMADGTVESIPTAALVIAHPLADIDRTLADLRLILFLVGLSGVAVALALGYGAARAMIRPVERLTAAAEHVAATQDLAARIDEEGDDELARLGHSFNAMLGALESSRQQQAQLVADAGHELRTPLTSLRTNIELLMKAPDLPSQDRNELLGDVRAQLEELTTLVGDLVDMARDDEQLSEPIEIRLDQIVQRAVERARRRATSLTYDVHLEAGDVRGQPALLERAVLNVLDNAAKWSPPAGSIEVTLTRGTTWVLQVRDHGPGIAPEDLPKVFDRFYRAPTARSLPGSGLGLAIVRQAVESHGGSVSAQLPPGGGALVRIELPLSAPVLGWPPAPAPAPGQAVPPLDPPEAEHRVPGQRVPGQPEAGQPDATRPPAPVWPPPPAAPAYDPIPSSSDR